MSGVDPEAKSLGFPWHCPRRVPSLPRELGLATDETVIDLVNTHFMPIEVDAEARPDIGERYSDWAWPATIFLAPDATQVLAIRGRRLPRCNLRSKRGTTRSIWNARPGLAETHWNGASRQYSA